MEWGVWAQCHFMGIVTIASTTTLQGSQTNTTLPVLQMKKQINVTFICVSAKNISTELWAETLPSVAVPLRGQLVGRTARAFWGSSACWL